MTWRRRSAHQADSPGLAFEVAEAAADFEAVPGEKLRAHCAVVDAFGDANQGQRREAVGLVDGKPEAERLEPLAKGVGLLTVTRLAGFETFFEHDSQCFV